MAATEETITILKVGTDQAVQSVNDLKSNISQLKKELGDLTIGSEEYQNKLDELKVNQNALKDAMYATSASMEDLAASATGTSETYNSLVHRMAAMKEELRATDVSTKEGKARFAELSKEINEVNNQLKNMDAAQGNFQRNVGNYKSAVDGLAGSFQKTAGSAGNIVNPLKNATSGLQAMSATPVIAILGLLANVIGKVIESMKKSEAATGDLTKAFAGFGALTDLMTKGLQALGGAVAWIIEKFSDLITSITGVSEAQKERIAITEKELELAERQRGNLVQNATLEKEVAELRAKAAQKDKYSAQERIAYLEAAAEKEKEISANAYKEAQMQYDIVKRKNALAESTAEEKQKEAEAEAAMIRTETAYFQKVRELNGQISEARKAMAAESAAAQKKREEALKKEEETLTKVVTDIDKEIAAQEDKLMSEVGESAKKANAIAEGNAKGQLVTLAESLARQLEANEVLEQDDREKAANRYAITEEMNQRRLALLEQFAQEASQRGDLDAYLKYDKEAADLSVTIEQNAAREKKRIREQDNKDAKEKAKTNLTIMQTSASAVSGILGNIADMYEANGDESEEAQNRIKGLRIAAATIDTIQGAIAAYTGTIEAIPGPIGLALGAVNAATVTATGLANIAKIKATQVGSSSTTSDASTTLSAAVEAPSLSPDVTSVRSITTATDEERLNELQSSQRVYILSSDIEASQKARKVQVSESSF